MTIKDIFDTPISELWNMVSPFAIGYLIFFGVFFVLVLSFIIFTFIKVMKGHKEFEEMRKGRFKRRY